MLDKLDYDSFLYICKYLNQNEILALSITNKSIRHNIIYNMKPIYKNIYNNTFFGKKIITEYVNNYYEFIFNMLKIKFLHMEVFDIQSLAVGNPSYDRINYDFLKQLDYNYDNYLKINRILKIINNYKMFLPRNESKYKQILYGNIN
jgi:hypothetical protein